MKLLTKEADYELNIPEIRRGKTFDYDDKQWEIIEAQPVKITIKAGGRFCIRLKARAGYEAIDGIIII